MGAIFKNYTTNSGSTLDRLFNMQFKDCAAFITKMDTMEKAEMAAKIQPILVSLYAQADRYGNSDYPRDEQIGPDIFLFVMTKIKRWETVLYWLYEIDIMMEETKLDELIREATKRLQDNYHDENATRIRLQDGEDGKKHRVYVNIREDYATLQAERQARGNHTDEIMDLAKQLAGKYFR